MNKKILLRIWRAGLLLGILIFAGWINPFYVFAIAMLYYIVVVMSYSLFGVLLFVSFFMIVGNGLMYISTFNNKPLEDFKEGLEMLSYVLVAPFSIVYSYVMDEGYGEYEI